jgi:ABC-type nitrate/sulfonate/bicarbonate transport system substrate-binding protein
MPPIRPYPPSFAGRVVDLGRGGLSPAEIAVELGASLLDLEAWSAEHPAFAVALADADTAACAWWDAQPRLAWSARKSFKAAVWAKGYAQRFGRSSDRPLQKTKARPEPEPAVETVFEIPDNGRRRRRKPKAGA